MMEQWEKAREKVSALTQREKVLLLLSGLILIPGIIDFFLLQPLRDATFLEQQQTQIINERMLSFNNQQEELLLEISQDPAMELEIRIEGLSKALAVTKRKLISYTDSLISPQKMASMLENMLAERGKLKLVSLENLPVAPLFDNNQEKTPTESEDVFGLYRHGIRLVFKGNYMATMDYLKSLEDLPWKFYWQNFDYQVEEYPNAEITLNIYTLSTSKWWIGDEDES